MLTDSEQREIEKEVRHYPDKRAACIEALKIVQRHHGWVSDDDVKNLAGVLGMTADELDGVATFYNLVFRKPVGRHVILLCDSISCWIMGYEEVRRHLSDRLGIRMGETTPDDRFTLLPVVCLGACHRAPSMMVDEDLHENLTPERIDQALDTYR